MSSLCLDNDVYEDALLLVFYVKIDIDRWKKT